MKANFKTDHNDIKFEIEKLNLYYGSFQALKEIDMTIYGNKITALIGLSGCGKSTFIRTLNRMNDLIQGVTIEGIIQFDNRDIYGNWYDIIELRKKVGMGFQKP
ncbi:MAG: ATP-binding cassette domain-containing protein, partial [Eubacteriales bacterium]|nr:ATP-binding cassette domain-containing protein [Eubacteriales bacterium]